MAPVCPSCYNRQCVRSKNWKLENCKIVTMSESDSVKNLEIEPKTETMTEPKTETMTEPKTESATD
jgi:hypothetical protein